jgi:hypothetical protein
MPPRDRRNIYIGAKYDLDDLIKDPAKVLQQMSVRIFNRREEELRKLEGQTIHYFTDHSLNSGVIKSFDQSNYVRIQKPDKTIQRINVNRLVLM